MLFSLPIALVLAALPALLLIVYFNRLDRKRPEPRSLIVKSVLFGFLAVLPAIVIEYALIWVLPRDMNPWVRAAVNGFIVAGLVEEAVKFFFINNVFLKRKEFDEVADGIVYSVCVSLGFALVENLMYAFSENWGYILLLRSVTAVPMHAAASGIMGYFIGLSKTRGTDKRATGLAWAIFIHGFYDFCAFSQSILAFLVIPIVIVSLIAVRRLFRKAVALDDETPAIDRKP
jgi:RsiW-degrading membrane proteinase PrsW (M82 family)